MKKAILSIAVIVGWVITTISQPCLPDGITFTTQSQIDSFPIHYPNCHYIEGNVNIGIGSTQGTDITNLLGLSIIDSIGGNLIIFGNDHLISLDGLNNLTNIVGKLRIGELYGWQGTWGNMSLANLSGLDNLESVGGSFLVAGNEGLINLQGIETLTSIGQSLGVMYNTSLISLSGIDNIDPSTIIELYIWWNPSLSNCAVQSICEYILDPGIIDIGDNASGCDTPEEIEQACESLSILENDLSSQISIYPNPAHSKITIAIPPGKEIDEICIYNRIGQRLIHQKGNGKVVDVSVLQAGMYVVEVIVDGIAVRKKLVKL